PAPVRAEGDSPAKAPMEARIAHLFAPSNDAHPLIRLRDLHDLLGIILCEELDGKSLKQAEQLLDAARHVHVDVPAGSELEGWLKHYRLALDAIDLPAIGGRTPEPSEWNVELATSSGRALDWAKVQAASKRLGAKAIFFAAADRKYVDLYARWYVNS